VEDLNPTPRRTPPEKQSAPPRVATPATGVYRVQRGDTLYSIAFRNGVDFRDLAAWNDIPAPYTIYPGRELKLSAASATRRKPVAQTSPPVRPASAPAPAKPAAPASSVPAPFEPVAATPLSPKPPDAPPPASTPVATNPPPTPATPPAPTPVAANGDIAWRWPADGQVVGGYVAGDQMRQGVDIAGSSGAPVRAAADGTVVYSGNGLIGYGELIIIKHNAAFLSAYGHNRKRLVQEGERVKSGQTIAEMGSTSANRDELHFEIRKNGKPANPLEYLPRR
jgi:lipoprotein NlpD